MASQQAAGTAAELQTWLACLRARGTSFGGSTTSSEEADDPGIKMLEPVSSFY